MQIAARVAKEILLERGWRVTIDETILMKNGYMLHLDNTANDTQRTSFVYTEEEQQSLINSGYNLSSALYSKALQPAKSLIQLSGEHYYIEKNGWLFIKGRYPSSYNNLSVKDLKAGIKAAIKFNELLDQFEDIAGRDYVGARGVKQHLVKGTKTEACFKAVPSGEHIREGCYIGVQENSADCDIFTKDAIFLVKIILDEVVIVTAVNKNGNVTNKNYEVSPSVFLNEAVNKNIVAVNLKPDTEEVEFEAWTTFSDEDMNAVIPPEIEELLTTDAQRECVMSLIRSKENCTYALNDKITEDAYPYLAGLIKAGAGSVELFNMRLGAQIAKLYLQYASNGYNPVRFYDETIDVFSMEEELNAALEETAAYKARLQQENLEPELVDILQQYYFKAGKPLDVTCDEATRWQAILPYCLSDIFDRETAKELSDLCKLYGVFSEAGCMLKTGFLSATLKGLIMNYFRLPCDFSFKDKPWDEFILDILNSTARILFTRDGLYVVGSNLYLTRDINSIATTSITREPVWRGVIVNEKIITYGADSSTLSFD